MQNDHDIKMVKKHRQLQMLDKEYQKTNRATAVLQKISSHSFAVQKMLLREKKQSQRI